MFMAILRYTGSKGDNMDEKIVVAVILGTKREGRLSERAARWVAEQGAQRGDIEVIFVDPRDFNLPPDGAPEDGTDPKYSEITTKADAFFIVTPEYNNSFPGSLKRLLDSEYQNYMHKPVMLAGVSNGPWGGVRACIALQPVCHSLGLVNIPKKLYFPKAQEIFDEQGAMNQQYLEGYLKSTKTAYDELVWFARALKAAKS
jgi:NAD(P)H-dependent FMN reductase